MEEWPLLPEWHQTWFRPLSGVSGPTACRARLSSQRLAPWPPVSWQLEFDEMILINIFESKVEYWCHSAVFWQGQGAPGGVHLPRLCRGLRVRALGGGPRPGQVPTHTVATPPRSLAANEGSPGLRVLPLVSPVVYRDHRLTERKQTPGVPGPPPHKVWVRGRSAWAFQKGNQGRGRLRDFPRQRASQQQGGDTGLQVQGPPLPAPRQVGPFAGTSTLLCSVQSMSAGIGETEGSRSEAIGWRSQH